MSKDTIQSLITNNALELTRPDTTTYKALQLSSALAIAQKTGRDLQEIEIASLQLDILPERYSRNQQTLSNSDQLRLLQSHVVVIGLGGLGGTVTEILARLGVGKLTLVDGDSFDESNLNRQLLSSVALLGQSKALAAKARVQAINPAVKAHAVKEFLSSENSSDILANADLAIDCLDTITDRFMLETACKQQDMPFISAAIGGTSGQATVVFPQDHGLENIYGSPNKAPHKGIEATVGTLPFAAIYMAAVECAEAATLLLGKQPMLRDRLFIAEVSDHTSEIFTLHKR